MPPDALKYRIPPTIAQAQNAGALDDLLRFMIVGKNLENFSWDALPKAVRNAKTFSFEGLLKIVRAEQGPKAQLAEIVDGVQTHLRATDSSARGTAASSNENVPRPIADALFAAWKPRIKDDWVFMFPVDRDPDSTSVSRATCDTRVTAACNIALKTASQRLKALDIVTFEIDPRTSYADYIEAGIDPAVLLQEEKFAPWRMVLGPGTAIRKACPACWNTRTDTLEAVSAFTSPTVLCESLDLYEELFALCGTWTSSQTCPHPRHEERTRSKSGRRAPRGSLVSVTDITGFAQNFRPPPSPPSSRDPSTGPMDVDAEAGPSYSSETHSQTTLPLPRLILKFPAPFRPKPVRTRKYDPAAHRQIIHARVIIKARKLTRDLREEVADVRQQSELVHLELERSKAETQLVQAQRSQATAQLNKAQATMEQYNTVMLAWRKLREDTLAQVAETEVALRKEIEDRHADAALAEAGQTRLAEQVQILEEQLRQAEERAKEVVGPNQAEVDAQMEELRSKHVEALEAGRRNKDRQASRIRTLNDRIDKLEAAERELAALKQAAGDSAKTATEIREELESAKTRETALLTRISLHSGEKRAIRKEAEDKLSSVRLEHELALQAAQQNTAAQLERDRQLSDQVATLNTQLTNMKTHYETQLWLQDQAALQSIGAFQADNEVLRAKIASAGASDAAEIQEARARIKDLEAELDDMWAKHRQNQSELGRLQRQSQKPAAQGGPTSGEVQVSRQAMIFNGNHADGLAVGIPVIQSGWPTPIPTPPATAIPSSTQQYAYAKPTWAAMPGASQVQVQPQPQPRSTPQVKASPKSQNQQLTWVQVSPAPKAVKVEQP